MNSVSLARLLLVDDDDDARTLMARGLHAAGYEVVEAADGAEAIAMDFAGFDMVLTDLQMPGRTGRDVLAAVRRADASIPVVVFTAYADAQSVLDLMAAGAYDYLPRPIEGTRLRVLVQRALDWRKLVRENNTLTRESARTPSPALESLLVGTSPAMLDVYKVVAQVAPTIATVLILGEPGTGKEIVARTIHARSGRTGPFVTVNCSALTDTTLSRELFGYEAHTDPETTAPRRGLVEDAEGGTIFLDEIDEVSPRVQAQILRMMTDRAITRVGGSEDIPVDFRLVAATSRDLSAEVSSGRFREDLLFRLQVVSVTVPPLNARKEDIPALVEHFAGHYASVLGRPAPVFAPDALAALTAYAWPGNIRELTQTLERMIVVAQGNAIVLDELPANIRVARVNTPGTEGIDTDWPTLAQVERRYIDRVLQHTRGNKTRAAAVLGVDRRTLSRLFSRAGIAYGARE